MRGNPSSVLLVGGGIVGLAAALVLGCASHQVTLLKRAAGYGLRHSGGDVRAAWQLYLSARCLRTGAGDR